MTHSFHIVSLPFVHHFSQLYNCILSYCKYHHSCHRIQYHHRLSTAKIFFLSKIFPSFLFCSFLYLLTLLHFQFLLFLLFFIIIQDWIPNSLFDILPPILGDDCIPIHITKHHPIPHMVSVLQQQNEYHILCHNIGFVIF